MCTHHSEIIDTEVDHFSDVVQVETIDGEEDNSGHILMTDLFSGLTVAATPPNMDPYTVIDTFFSNWVVGLNGDGYPTNMCTPVQAENWTQKKVGNYVKCWS